MKRLLRILPFLLALSTPLLSIGQSVGVSSTAITPDPESILELRSTTKGVLLPRLNNAQRATLQATPLGVGDEGLTIFNTQTDRYNYWDGAAWVEMATSGTVTGLSLEDAYNAGGAGLGRTILGNSGTVEILGSDGLYVAGNIGVGIAVPTMKLDVRAGDIGLDGLRSFVAGGWNTGIPDVTPDAQMVLDGAHNSGFNLGGTKLLIRGMDNESNGKAISVVDENSFELFNIQSQPTGYGRTYFRGDVGIGISTAAVDLHIYRADTDIARVYATGGSQGSGMFYAGQSITYGGGFSYDGDGTPALVGATDRITFFRRNNNADADVMSYAYDSNTVRLTSLAGTGTRSVYAAANGDFTTTGPTSGINGYWSRTGTNLSPTSIGDNVGIGTASATHKLAIAGTGTIFGVDNQSTFAARNSGGTFENYFWPRWSDNIMYMNYGSGGMHIRNNSSTTTLFMTNSTNVGIGTTAPGARLHVVSSAAPGIRVERTAGQPSIEAFNDDWMIIDGESSSNGNVALNYYNSGRVILNNGGGNTGIGTTNPTSKLTVAGGIGRTAHNYGHLEGGHNNISNTSTMTSPIYTIGTSYNPATTTLGNMYGIGYSHTNASFINDPGPNSWGMYVAADGDARIFLAASSTGDSYFNAGNVGIGNNDPGYKLHVSGRLKTTGINETSDVRLKKDINPIDHALEDVLQMRGVTYNWRTEEYPDMGLNEDLQHGLIAQELEEIIPDLVLTDEEGYKSIEYTHLVPVLIEALKEQQNIIDSQNGHISNQANDISDLKVESKQMQETLNSILNQLNGYSSIDQ